MDELIILPYNDNKEMLCSKNIGVKIAFDPNNRDMATEGEET